MIPLGGFVRSSFGLLCFGTRRGTLGLHAISEKHRTAGVKNWGGAPRNLLQKIRGSYLYSSFIFG